MRLAQKNKIKAKLGFLKYPVYLFRYVLVRTDKRFFAFLFNLQSVCQGSKTRCNWDGTSFVVTDKAFPALKLRIRHQNVCNYNYQYGILSRIQYLQECYFLEQIGFRDGDTIIDCGANIGDLKLWFDHQGLDVTYIGFEPSPIEFGCLKANVHPSAAHNIGLWHEEGELDFYISSHGADSSLIEPKKYEKVITTKVERLENYIKGRTKCLKLEAEGCEPEILRGLGDKVKLFDYITADLGFERGVNEESTLIPVTNYLLSRGFELADLSSDARRSALFRNRREN